MPETAWLYRQCRDCHLFVEPNPAFGDYPGLAEWTHLHRGDGEDVALDESHEPVPAGLAQPLDWWREHGPAAMRVRFVDNEEEPHVGHFSRLGGTWWCDTCNSPYCDLA